MTPAESKASAYAFKGKKLTDLTRDETLVLLMHFIDKAKRPVSKPYDPKSNPFRPNARMDDMFGDLFKSFGGSP